MVADEFKRTALLIGEDNITKLSQKKVILFGVGGVGGYIAESLARCNLGQIDLVDNDIINISNINRQIVATHSKIGLSKVDVMKERIIDINPNCKVEVFKQFYTNENCEFVDLSNYDYVIDAIDTISAKILLVKKCQEYKIPIICCMGTGNKFNPTMFRIDDIYKTDICPVCRIMRKLCRDNGIKSLKVLYSKENPIKFDMSEFVGEKMVGSISFVPSVAGLIISSEVVKDLTN